MADLDREVRDSLVRSLAQPRFSHLDLVRSQVPLSQGAAPGICIAAGEAMGADRSLLEPAAEALALLETMVSILRDLTFPEEASPGSLIGEWQMPRTLNAADACYALAHQRLLELRTHAGMSAEVVFAAVTLLDETSRDLSEVLADAMTAEGAGWQKQAELVLTSAAVGFAAIFAGMDAAGSMRAEQRYAAAVDALEKFAKDSGLAIDDASSLILKALQWVRGGS